MGMTHNAIWLNITQGKTEARSISGEAQIYSIYSMLSESIGSQSENDLNKVLKNNIQLYGPRQVEKRGQLEL